MALPATGFVHFLRANDDDGVVIMSRFAIDQPLGAVGWFTTNDANGLKFIDLIGLGEEEGDGAKRFPAEVHVQPGDDDAEATVGEAVGDFGDFGVEELGFINAHDGGVALQMGEDRAGRVNGHGFKNVAIVGRDFFYGIPIVDDGFENLYLLTGDGGAAQAANQFVGFAAKHGADDDFNGTVMMFHAAHSTIKTKPS